MCRKNGKAELEYRLWRNDCIFGNDNYVLRANLSLAQLSAYRTTYIVFCVFDWSAFWFQLYYRSQKTPTSFLTHHIASNRFVKYKTPVTSPSYPCWIIYFNQLFRGLASSINTPSILFLWGVWTPAPEPLAHSAPSKFSYLIFSRDIARTFRQPYQQKRHGKLAELSIL